MSTIILEFGEFKRTPPETQTVGIVIIEQNVNPTETTID